MIRVRSRPSAPAPTTECCQSGCDPCIFDYYNDEMERYRQELKAWEARRAARRGATHPFHVVTPGRWKTFLDLVAPSAPVRADRRGHQHGPGIPGYRDEQGRWQRAAPMTITAFLSARRARASATGAQHGRLACGGQCAAEREPSRWWRGWETRGAWPGWSRRMWMATSGPAARGGRTAWQHRAGHLPVLRHALPARGHPALAVAAQSRIPRCVGAAGGRWRRPSGIPTVRRFLGARVRALRRAAEADVVFFGESVPRERVTAGQLALDAADAVLVIGSSLTVFSGYRFCVWAHGARLADCRPEPLAPRGPIRC